MSRWTDIRGSITSPIRKVVNNPFLNPIGVGGSKPIEAATGMNYEDQLKTGAVIGGLAGAAGYGTVPNGGMVDPVTGLPDAGAVPYEGGGAAWAPSSAAVGGGTATALGSGAGGAAGAGLTWKDALPLAAPIIGYAGSKDIANQQDALAREYMAMGAPYRGRLAELYNNPEAYLATQRGDIEKNVQRGTDIMSRSLSMGGNPVGSGNALQQLQNYASEGMDAGLYNRLNAERQNMANFGGLSQFNAAAPQVASNAIGAQGNTWNAIGAGAETLSNIFNPPKKSASDLYWERRAKAEGY